MPSDPTASARSLAGERTRIVNRMKAALSAARHPRLQTEADARLLQRLETTCERPRACQYRPNTFD